MPLSNDEGSSSSSSSMLIAGNRFVVLPPITTPRTSLDNEAGRVSLGSSFIDATNDDTIKLVVEPPSMIAPRMLSIESVLCRCDSSRLVGVMIEAMLSMVAMLRLVVVSLSSSASAVPLLLMQLADAVFRGGHGRPIQISSQIFPIFSQYIMS